MLSGLCLPGTESRDSLEQTVSPFSTLRSWWVLVALAPLVLTLLLIVIGYTITGGEDPAFVPEFPTLVYGIANVAVIVGLYGRVSHPVWRASTRAERLSRTELAAGILATGVGFGVGWPATTILADAIGVPRYTIPSLSSTPELVIVFFTAVIVAPIAEEVLFRGLLLGILLERGYGPAVAGVGSLLVFGMLHVFMYGIGGVINALALGLLLTWLRLQFDSLVGAWLMHLLNNLLEFLVILSVLPSLYAL